MTPPSVPNVPTWTNGSRAGTDRRRRAAIIPSDPRGRDTIATAGDTVTVTAGSVGRYWAPEYARMLAIYAPNPGGLPVRRHGLPLPLTGLAL
jgi:hypothetical protein